MSTITTINPATEEAIQTYDIFTEKEATDRLEARHTAFLEWRKLTHQDRALYLQTIGRSNLSHRGIAADKRDLVTFGRPFTANRDLSSLARRLDLDEGCPPLRNCVEKQEICHVRNYA